MTRGKVTYESLLRRYPNGAPVTVDGSWGVVTSSALQGRVINGRNRPVIVLSGHWTHGSRKGLFFSIVRYS